VKSAILRTAGKAALVRLLGELMDFVLAGIISVALLIYLGYALFYPEKF
jgi:K+-transporting ATPase KdpF subunit